MADIFFGTLAVLAAIAVVAVGLFVAMVAINMSRLSWKVPKIEERDKVMIDAFRVAVKLQPLLKDAEDYSQINMAQAVTDMNAYWRLYHTLMKIDEGELRIFVARMTGPHGLADQMQLTFR